VQRHDSKPVLTTTDTPRRLQAWSSTLGKNSLSGARLGSRSEAHTRALQNTPKILGCSHVVYPGGATLAAVAFVKGGGQSCSAPRHPPAKRHFAVVGSWEWRSPKPRLRFSGGHDRRMSGLGWLPKRFVQKFQDIRIQLAIFVFFSFRWLSLKICQLRLAEGALNGFFRMAIASVERSRYAG